ncbi:MAG: DUF5318 domain-containing protein, partial [Actinomycetota bacterium]|nr:DUF5318 domain-containing protein [Actinomycetota bacterium]
MPAAEAAPGRGPRGVVRRDVVDHALARRRLLQEVRGGGLFSTVSEDDVCDASPYLKRAARAYGVRTDRTCPLCRRDVVWEVSWVFGEAIGAASGSARSAAQVARLAADHPDFAVHEVEVCQRCGWNHLLRSWRTGTPGTRPARRSRER